MQSILDIFDKLTVPEELAERFDRAEIENCCVNMDEKAVKVSLISKTLINMRDILMFEKQAETIYSLNRVYVDVKYENITFTPEYFNTILFKFIREHGTCRAFLAGCQGRLSGTSLIIEEINGGKEALKKARFAEFIKIHINHDIGACDEVKLKFKEETIEEYLERSEKIDRELAQKAAASLAAPKTHASKQPASGGRKQGVVFGKSASRNLKSIISLTPGGEPCAIEGKIIDFEVRETRKNPKFGSNTIVTCDIGDNEWAVACKIFAKTEKVKSLAATLKKGLLMRFEGAYEIDDYSKKPLFMISCAEVLPQPPKREDNAEHKRVELHMHTKMSAMDAVTSVGELVNRAAEWGHTAIAITDHGVAQAFPDAHKAAQGVRKSGKDFKIIYGLEGYLINDEDSALKMTSKCRRDAEYVVFDIETTGLSAGEDKITEIGAVKVKNGKICDKFAQLINPERSIPYRITELTGISDQMVEGEPSISEVLPKFMEFCGDLPIVAHNAKFDTGFIRVNCAAVGLPFDNEILDTLQISRELFPNESRHNLDAVTKRMGVSLENHHRAVDDATATAEVFIKFMDMAANVPMKAEKDILKSDRYHIIILAKNYEGLKNLYRLISQSNLNYFYKKPLIPKSVLSEHRNGLIIGSACEQGELYKAVLNLRPDEEINAIAEYYDYLEIQPLGNNAFMLREGMVTSEEELKNINRRIVKLGEQLNKPVCATCDVHFMDPEDEVYRRVLMGAQGFSDADNQAPLYLRTTEEMLEEFQYLGSEKAYEVVIKNTNLIADMVEQIQPVKDGSYPPTIENCEQDLIDMCHKKAHDIYGETLPVIVKERMDRELDCITKYGFSVMYMIAHKLVKKSNEAGYLVGSRGSVGSSFAAFLSDITEVNALCPHYVCPKCKHSKFFDNGEYGVGMDMPDADCPKCGAKMKKDGLTIPFETFLGFEGDKVPDIDLNFSGEYQATAHKYVGELFGEEYVFKAGTIGTIADKTAYGFAKKYYETKGIEATDAELKRVSVGMIDVKRTTGQHPGGIIVCPKTMDIHDFCPIQHPADKKDSDIITTHFDFHSIHDNLLKLDILGHDDPSTIRMLEDLTGMNALEIPLDDKETMSLFSSTEALGLKPEQIDSQVGTFGVPEFGTSFVRGMLLDTKPTTFNELLIISGLSHGTDVWLGNAQELIKNKICTLSEVIGLRDDIMVYLLQHGLEPKMAFTIMEFVRKGRAAKEGMPEEYEKAMRENNVPEWYINSCKKIKYMFPKAHAAAYVMMAFRIAYFKVHCPIDFYIAYYTVRADLFDAAIMANGVQKVRAEMKRIKLKSDATANEQSLYTILELCLEMYERGINFLPVDLYKSHAFKFKKIDGAILPPLNAFQGIGTSAAEAIVRAREDGPFLSQEDLKQRSGVNKTVVETLKENGVLDDLPETSQMNMFEMMG